MPFRNKFYFHAKIFAFMKIISPLLIFIAITITTSYFKADAQSPFDTATYSRNAKAGDYLTMRGFKMYYEIYG